MRMMAAAVVLLSLLCASALAQSNTVTVNWDDVLLVSKTSVTLQVVVNPYVQRGSPIHEGTFEALKNLEADYVRFVPWLPYPRLGVAELEPPTGNPVCASAAENETLYIACYKGVFETIDFVSYGNPGGRCGGFSVGDCNMNSSRQIVEKACIGMEECAINVTAAVFGLPCQNVSRRLAIQASCSVSVDKTFWNFTYIDPLMEDFMKATKNHSVIINFSTIPQWLYNTPEPVHYPANPETVTWDYEQGTDLRDNSLQDLGNYYKRLVSWYTLGGFYDEYSVYHESGHHYDIPMWEVLNEIESEHGMSPEMYTRVYDAITSAISDVQPNMTFVGLALMGREPNYVSYFLNASNHAPDAPLDWISYHFYAGAENRTNISQYELFFPTADTLFTEVAVLQKIRNNLAPWVKTTIDEIGCILPDDNAYDPFPAPIPDLYWNAVGGMFAYIFANLVHQEIEVLGSSQLVGYPTQYPSVSLMDWNTAEPNSRYWTLYLLHNVFHAGDKVVNTTFDGVMKNNGTAIHAQGFQTPDGKQILIINKTEDPQEVTITDVHAGTVTYVDPTTYNSPPQTVKLSGSTFILNSFAVAVVTVL